MKNYFIILLTCLAFCGCAAESSPSDNNSQSTMPAETTESPATEKNEEVTQPVGDVDVVSIFQSILLNEKTIRFTEDYGFDYDYGYFYLKDRRDDYYAFSVVDFNHDGQNEICLYAGTSDGHGVDIISYEKGEAVLIGVDAYSMIMYSDGYLGYSTNNAWVRKTMDMYLEEEFYYAWHGYYNEMEISKEELEERKLYFSSTVAPKYELTKENIMKYVVLEAEQTDSIPENVKPNKVDYFTLSAIQQVLLNKKSFVDENGKKMKVENLDKFYSDGKTKGATFFTVWDMNKDGNDEVIVKLEGDEISHVIFTEKKGVVYGKEVSLEEFSAIFTDNTYNFNSEGLVVRGEIIIEDSLCTKKIISAYQGIVGGTINVYVARDGILGSNSAWHEYEEIMAKYSKEVVPAHLFTVDNVIDILK